MPFLKKNDPKKQKEPAKIQLMKSGFRTALMGLLSARFRIEMMLFSLTNLAAYSVILHVVYSTLNVI